MTDHAVGRPKLTTGPTLSDQAYRALREDITSGALQPGQRRHVADRGERQDQAFQPRQAGERGRSMTRVSRSPSTRSCVRPASGVSRAILTPVSVIQEMVSPPDRQAATLSGCPSRSVAS